MPSILYRLHPSHSRLLHTAALVRNKTELRSPPPSNPQSKTSKERKRTPIDELVSPIDVRLTTPRCITNSKLATPTGMSPSWPQPPSPPTSVSDSQDRPQFRMEPVDARFIIATLEKFREDPLILELAQQHRLSEKLFDTVLRSFRRHCSTPSEWDTALAVTLHDIKHQRQSEHSLFPLFLAHARRVYPHLEYMEELQALSDMRQPHKWYPEARAIERRVIFHAGPTNSGKTHEALEAFKAASSGQYAGPLRLLAAEIWRKMNEAGVPCDLATGEDRRYVNGPDQPAPHVAMTVEMMSVHTTTEVAIIDEVQMLRDSERGGAWSRALLGAASREVHLCGEESAIDIVQKLVDPIGEKVEVRRYERLSPLVMSTHALRNLANVEDGDCIVCFNRRSIFSLAHELHRVHRREAAVIFGALPPLTKLEQAKKFNDPTHPCKVLLATDAIGMGINLNIRRVIFYSVFRRKGEMLHAYHAKQIAGRAGRFRHHYDSGEVMAFEEEDNERLAALMVEPIADIQQAGITPSADQVETFSYHLPNASLANLLEIFHSVSTLHPHYFSCGQESVRNLARLIEHIPNLAIRDRYTFCLVPISGDRKFLSTFFVKLVKRYADNQMITYDFLLQLIRHLMVPASRPEALMDLNDAFDAVGAYLWLSYRFPNHFIDAEQVRKLEPIINKMVEKSISQLIKKGR